jgi:uncharacterized protein involved in exopolysaccharide biosynthesis
MIALPFPHRGIPALELRSLVHVIVSRWWLVLPVFLLTTAVAVGLTLTQERLYQATSTLVVTPSQNIQNETLSALAVIARQTEITDTYAQIASSRSIRQSAAERLQLTPDQRSSVSVASRLIAGTTLLEIDAVSPDPGLAAAYANAVSQALVEYVAANYGIFEVDILDSAVEPNRPVSPEVPLNIALGVVGGLMLGIGLALAVHLLAPPAQDAVPSSPWWSASRRTGRIARRLDRMS